MFKTDNGQSVGSVAFDPAAAFSSGTAATSVQPAPAASASPFPFGSEMPAAGGFVPAEPKPAHAPALTTEQKLAQLKAFTNDILRRLNEENIKLKARLSTLDGITPEDKLTDALPPEFHGFYANRALYKLLTSRQFDTVLDIGSGQGQQAAVMLRHGKTVTALDYGKSPYYEWRDPAIKTVIGDFNAMEFETPFDCVWASHVLEHQPNPNFFLTKIHAAVREGGIVAITVPPLKHTIVGGHVALWNGGMLLYHMVLAGFDCSDASILQYGYNISIIVTKRSIPMPDVGYDMGDIRKIRPYLPRSLEFTVKEHDDAFNGDIHRLNW